METEKKGIKLTNKDADILRQYCKGCRMFRPDKNVRSICSLVGWYNKFNIKEIVEYVKHCPCNEKCIVKSCCLDEKCPIWLKYLQKILKVRDKRFKEQIDESRM